MGVAGAFALKSGRVEAICGPGRERRDRFVADNRGLSGVMLANSTGAMSPSAACKLGEPLCCECFDHHAAVVWNNALSELWRRTTIYLPRTLARLTSMTQKRLRELVRVAYVKVAEYQRRGLVHLQVVIRLDRAMPAYRAHEIHPPGAGFDAELLADAIRATAGDVSAPLDDVLGGGEVRWGDELDIRHLDPAARGEIAGYLAKYATKSIEQAGGVLHRVSAQQVDELPVREHVRAYLRAAFELADDPALTDRRFARCAHTLGYHGHCLTKSRRYSTTFKALREAREAFVHERLLARESDPARRPIERSASFATSGQGHLTAADALLAASAAARAREERRAAREARAMEVCTDSSVTGQTAANRAGRPV